MKQTSSLSLASALRAYMTAGLLIEQDTGRRPVFPATVGAIALDSKSGSAYTNTADGWVKIHGVDCRKLAG